MVFLTASSAKLVVDALNAIHQEVVAAKEVINVEETEVPVILSNLVQQYNAILESTRDATAFWSLTDRQAVTWALQNYSREFGTLKVELRSRTIGKGAVPEIKAALKECQSYHMDLLLRVGTLLSGGNRGAEVRDVSEEQLASAITAA